MAARGSDAVGAAAVGVVLLLGLVMLGFGMLRSLGRRFRAVGQMGHYWTYMGIYFPQQILIRDRAPGGGRPAEKSTGRPVRAMLVSQFLCREPLR